MEDIYDNLENYEDIIDVNELQNENKELKIKLEEYSRTMNQLQKDVDKLSSDYKTLERNYSSLLVTARAEIERKSDMIKTLNTEKDKLMINILQSKGKSMLIKSNGMGCDNIKTKGRQNDTDTKDNSSSEQCNRLVSEPSLSKNSNQKNDNKSTVKPDVAMHTLKNVDIKKNVITNAPKNNDGYLDKADVNLRLMNRRRSTPTTSFQEPKFSSDEEIDRPSEKYTRYLRRTNERDKRDSPYYQGSSDSSRSRNSHQMDYNTYRHNANYDTNRYQRARSPEQSHRYTSEFHRQRKLRSPPCDKYLPSTANSRVRRHNYERDNYERYPRDRCLKHKIRNDFDVSSTKRQKIEEYSKCPSQERNYFSDREKEVYSKPIPEHEIEQLSCQSPDLVHSDGSPHHSVKEIRNTASIKLPDPRIESQKYVELICKERTFLTIPYSRDIEFQRINNLLWNKGNVDVPKALQRRPSLVVEDYLNVIYKDLQETLEPGEIRCLEDDVLLKSKKEETYDNQTNLINTADKTNVISRSRCSLPADMAHQTNSKLMQKASSSRYVIPKIEKTEEPILKQNREQIKPLNKGDAGYEENGGRENDKFAKLKNNTKSPHTEFTTKSFIQNVQSRLETGASESYTVNTIEQDNIRTVEGDLELSDESDTIELEKHQATETKEVRDPQSRDDLSVHSGDKNDSGVNIKAAAADVKIDKKKRKSKEKEALTETESQDTIQDSSKNRRGKSKLESNETTKDKRKINERSVCIEPISSKDKKKSSSSKTVHSENQTSGPGNDSRGTRNTKKTTEGSAPRQSETICQDGNKPNDTCVYKNKNGKEICEDKACDKLSFDQTVNKFSDLFGDSSSLITPDDLGLPTGNKKVQQDVVSMFENTQDAMDVTVADINDRQAQSTKISFNTVIEILPNIDTADDQCLSGGTSNDIYLKKENLHENNKGNESKNAESSVESHNVIKTVVISTSVHSRDADTSYLSEKPINQEHVLNKFPLNREMVLATSTPYKSITHSDKMIPSNQSESVNSDGASIDVSSCNVSNSTSINKSEQQTDDEPDVRIFVKRKKRVVRKPT